MSEIATGQWRTVLDEAHGALRTVVEGVAGRRLGAAHAVRPVDGHPGAPARGRRPDRLRGGDRRWAGAGGGSVLALGPDRRTTGRPDCATRSTRRPGPSRGSPTTTPSVPTPLPQGELPAPRRRRRVCPRRRGARLGHRGGHRPAVSAHRRAGPTAAGGRPPDRRAAARLRRVRRGDRARRRRRRRGPSPDLPRPPAHLVRLTVSGRGAPDSATRHAPFRRTPPSARVIICGSRPDTGRKSTSAAGRAWPQWPGDRSPHPPCRPRTRRRRRWATAAGNCREVVRARPPWVTPSSPAWWPATASPSRSAPIAILILGLSARTSFRVGAAAALAVATADGLYAAVAAIGGAGLAGVIAPVAGPLRVAAARGAARARRPRTARRLARPPTRTPGPRRCGAGAGLDHPGPGLRRRTRTDPAEPDHRALLRGAGARPARRGRPGRRHRGALRRGRLPGLGELATARRRVAARWSAGRWPDPRGRLVTGLVSSALIAALAVATLLPG